MMSQLNLSVRWRAFKIWQKLGFLPWSQHKSKSRKGDFYKGAFDSIPFLNDDAKRTFVHLLLRPGYMIRDYIHGQHESYLAPLTSLIIFYAFFALVSSVIHPDFSTDKTTSKSPEEPVKVEISQKQPSDSLRQEDSDTLYLFDKKIVLKSKVEKVTAAFQLLTLDKHPERVDSSIKASLAAFEGSMRSQGVHLFLTHFLFLWFAMGLALKKKGMGIAACAAAAAYVLCQFCFFMFFSLFVPGHKGEIGVGLMGLLLTADYHQLFDVGWKQSIRLTVKTGICYLLAMALLTLIFTGIVCLVVALF